ncbi:MAG: preprotein translocase subunit SecE [Peptococcaceae bacterium]|jgi:preprotein translocase subunit SecE|nr:preprotein translocase subunit SecE [Peptococcaceae bacterium]
MGTVKKAEGAQGKFTKDIAEYFRGVWSELKKVYWPSRQQLVTYTIVVFVAVVIVAVLLGLIDSGLSFILSKIIPK